MFIRVADKERLKEAGIPYKPKTLYIYHSQGILPELFVKVRRTLFVDTDEWEKILKNAKKGVRTHARKKISGPQEQGLGWTNLEGTAVYTLTV